MQPTKTMTKTKITTSTKTIIVLAFVAAFGLAAIGFSQLPGSNSGNNTSAVNAKIASSDGACTFTVQGQIKVQDINMQPETHGTDNVIYDLADAQVKLSAKGDYETMYTEVASSKTGDEGRFQLKFSTSNTNYCTEGVYVMLQTKLANDYFEVQDAGIADTGFLVSPDWLVMFNYNGVAKMLPNTTWAFDGTLEGIEQHGYRGPYILFTTEPADVDPDVKDYNIQSSSDLTNQAGNDEAFMFVMANKVQKYLKSLGSKYAFNNKIEINYGESMLVRDESEISHAHSLTENIYVNPADMRGDIELNINGDAYIVLHELGHVWHYQHETGICTYDRPGHYFNDVECIAFHEGFARFFNDKMLAGIYSENYFYNILTDIETGYLYNKPEIVSGVETAEIAAELGYNFAFLTSLSVLDNSEFGWENIFKLLLTKDIYRYDFGSVDISDVNGDLPGGETFINQEYPSGECSCKNMNEMGCEFDYEVNEDSGTCFPVIESYAAPEELEDYNVYIDCLENDYYYQGIVGVDLNSSACPVSFYKKDTVVSCDVPSWDLSFTDILDVFLADSKAGYPNKINISEQTLNGFLERLDGISNKISSAQVGVMKEILDPTNKEQPKDIMGCKADFTIPSTF